MEVLSAHAGMALAQLQGLVGLGAILLLAWALSENRRARPGAAWIAGGLALQFAVAAVTTRVPLVWALVGYANEAVRAVERATLAGSSYMFGYTGGAPVPFVLRDGVETPVIIAFQVLPLIIVFSALSALLWHWGVLRLVVRLCAWALRRTMRVSGVVGLGGGATLILGVVETPLMLRAWLGRMTRAELFMVMVMIMATISGAILILYAATLAKTVPNAVGHMIVASLISLPAAVVVARLMVPEQEGPATAQDAQPELSYESSVDAVIRGTMDGVQLVLAVVGVIIAVFALVHLTDQVLGLLPDVAGSVLTLRRILGWLFSPVMWAIGVPWDQAPTAGALMGTKTVLNEYVAYLDLAALPPGTFTPRSLLIVTYALCGVANLASVGLLVSTIGAIAPDRRSTVVGLGMKSWVAGNMASAMTGAVIGLVTWI